MVFYPSNRNVRRRHSKGAWQNELPPQLPSDLCLCALAHPHLPHKPWIHIHTITAINNHLKSERNCNNNIPSHLLLWPGLGSFVTFSHVLLSPFYCSLCFYFRMRVWGCGLTHGDFFLLSPLVSAVGSTFSFPFPYLSTYLSTYLFFIYFCFTRSRRKSTSMWMTFLPPSFPLFLSSFLLPSFLFPHLVTLEFGGPIL